MDSKEYNKLSQKLHRKAISDNGNSYIRSLFFYMLGYCHEDSHFLEGLKERIDVQEKENNEC